MLQADDPASQRKATDPDATLAASKSSSSRPEVTVDSTPAETAQITSSDASQTRFTSIGRYRLLQKLGEGGMGQVWLAEQTAPVRRNVALKLIRAGMYDDTLLQRFQAERQSLAIMDHPSIAKVFDAGATSDGQPYFVMEYVQGLPISSYCDDHRLSLRERLALFIKVCEGVQHAHQKAIIHRDLKPANILVAEVDGKPMPRIIDFGLAKAATSSATNQTMFTHLGGFVGTPAYMSPEQADPGLEDVDTRTDVYSLGVVLYELLTGALPFDPKRWQNQPLREVLRQMQEEDSPRASTKIVSKEAAQARDTDPQQLVKVLRGDLDWIVAKALEKDRTRRYGTPSELAADIERYLRREPVTARPASAGYRLHKYVERHRVAVSVAAAIVVLLAGSIVLQSVQLQRTRLERDRANRERDRATRVTDFMTKMFNVSDPSESRGNTVTAREVLDKASADIDTGLGKDPELQAQMMFVMGSVYDGLGLYQKAESLMRRALEIRTRVSGPTNAATLDTESLLGGILWQLGRYTESENLLRQAYTESRAVLGPLHRTTLGLEEELASALSEEQKFGEAEKLARDCFENNRRVFGPDDKGTIQMMFLLSAVLGDEGKYAESEKLNRESLDLSARVNGPDHPQTLGMMDALADTLSDEAHYAEAEKLDQQSLEISLRVNGAHHPSTAGFEYNLGCLAALQGQPQRALTLLRQSVDSGLRNNTALKMDSDPDLKSLHGNPEFAKILADAKQRALAQNARKGPSPSIK